MAVPYFLHRDKGFPALLISAWASVVEFVWKQERFMRYNKTSTGGDCWYQHADSQFYMIIEVPRLCFIFINLIFLVNIIRGSCKNVMEWSMQ